jgi:phosphonate transport system ATP-binding protein
MLTVEGLSKTYDGGEEALIDVSFTVRGTDTVAIIGPSGAGKSTLVRCINRLVEPTDGLVSLDRTEITALGDDGLREARCDISMVFQEYNLVERLTVMENVLSGRLGHVSCWRALRRDFPEEDVRHAKKLLASVGMSDQLDSRVDELSGGQRQRVGVARALVQEPEILLADEPTSSLDPENSRTLMDMITELAQDKNIPVLVNLHDVQLAREYADRILGLSGGEIVFDGPPEQLDQDAQDRIYKGRAEFRGDQTAKRDGGDEAESDPIVQG